MTEKEYNCVYCGVSTIEPDLLVCNFCYGKIKELKTRKGLDVWRRIGIERYQNAREQVMGLCSCFHCGKTLQVKTDENSQGMVCGDHWPFTRGAEPRLMFHLKNFRPSCQECNTSGSPNRKVPTEMELQPLYDYLQTLRP